MSAIQTAERTGSNAEQCTATIKTDRASGYLQQLCKHFGHKTDVRFTPDEGQISFGFGTGSLSASDGALTMVARANSDEDLARLRRVLASHLERFAFREDLNINWED